MTPQQWIAVCEEVDSLWGSTKQWHTARSAAYKFAKTLDPDAAMGAVQDAMLDGRARPPSPSEVIANTRFAGGIVEDLDPSPCGHKTFAIIDYHPDGTAKTAICSRCHTEIRKQPGKARSVGDLERLADEALAEEHRAPKDDAVPDNITPIDTQTTTEDIAP